MDRISLDPGDLFIQAMEPFNIIDVVIGRDETVRSLSSVVLFDVTLSLEAACFPLRCVKPLLASPRKGNVVF